MVMVAANPARDVPGDLFTDITSVAVSNMRWQDGVLEVTFDGDLTEAQVLAVQARMESRNANEETLRAQALQALTTNRTFLDLASPTNAQTLAQVKALTRQSTGVIRQVLGLLDGTD